MIASVTRFLAIPILVIAVPLGAPGQSIVYQPKIGQPHRDFELPSIADGKPIRLSEYRGKKLLLMHFASW